MWHQTRNLLRSSTLSRGLATSSDGNWLQNWRRRSKTEQAVHSEQIVGRRTPKQARLEAVLIISDKPVSLARLTQHALLASNEETRLLIDELNALYDEVSTPFRVEKLAAGYQLMTRAEYAFWLSRMHDRKQEQSISDSAMEVLVIIAYRQPLTRAEIESVRGVQCIELVKVLMEKGLVKITGQADTLGRPYLYGTTKKFLETYGLRSLNELPMKEVLRPQKDVVPDQDGESVDDESVAA